jgi:drug/metabolite transporter (DMT)-like permease
MGRVHQFADRRLRLPGIAGLAFTVAGTAFVAGADRLGATIAGIVGVIASVMWLVIYSRISAPINARLTAAALSGETPLDTKLLQQRWDSVITARSALQLLMMLSLCLVLIAS